MIPKFQNPWKPINWEKEARISQNRQNASAQIFEKTAQDMITTANQRYAQRTKADQVANRKTKAPMKPNNTAILQDNLWKIGAFNEVKDRRGNNLTYESAVDGLRARSGKGTTDQAIAWAKANGYDVDEKSGMVKKSNPIKVTNKEITTTPNTPSPKKIMPISLEEAQKYYQNGTGNLDVYSSFLYHVIAPKFKAMPHSSGLKDQIAAEIAYTEGLPKSSREKPWKSQLLPGQTYVGYSTHGKMINSDENINNQGTKNNGTSRVMGGYRYVINDDGSVDVKDGYSFGVVRDFTRKNGKGKKPYVYGENEDPYTGRPWAGLYHDITTSGEGKSLQHLAENFGTRQGKSRKNDIHFEPGEINRRNSTNLQRRQDEKNIHDNFYSNYWLTK